MKIEHISGSIVESFVHFVFIVCQVEDNQNTLKLSSRLLAYTSYKALKGGLELVSVPHFLRDF